MRVTVERSPIFNSHSLTWTKLHVSAHSKPTLRKSRLRTPHTAQRGHFRAFGVHFHEIVHVIKNVFALAFAFLRALLKRRLFCFHQLCQLAISKDTKSDGFGPFSISSVVHHTDHKKKLQTETAARTVNPHRNFSRCTRQLTKGRIRAHTWTSRLSASSASPKQSLDFM